MDSSNVKGLSRVYKSKSYEEQNTVTFIVGVQINAHNFFTQMNMHTMYIFHTGKFIAIEHVNLSPTLIAIGRYGLKSSSSSGKIHVSTMT